MKITIILFCLFLPRLCLNDSKTNYGQDIDHFYLSIEKVRVENGKSYRQFFRRYNSNNDVILHVEGNFNTTDSVVYKYNYPNGTVEIKKFKPGENGGLVLEELHTESIQKDVNPFLLDSFDLYDVNNFLEIANTYKNKLKTYKLETDSGIVNKYEYDIGEEAFIVLPYTSNNRGADVAEKLDSLILYCKNKKVVIEEYFFERNKQVIRKYYYNDSRLIRLRTDLLLEHKNVEGFDEVYNYNMLVGPK